MTLLTETGSFSFNSQARNERKSRKHWQAERTLQLAKALRNDDDARGLHHAHLRLRARRRQVPFALLHHVPLPDAADAHLRRRRARAQRQGRAHVAAERARVVPATKVSQKTVSPSSLCCGCSHLALARPDLRVGHWEAGLVDALRRRVGHRVAAVACRRRVGAGRLRTSVASEHRQTARLGQTDKSELCEDRSGNSQTLWGARAC